MNSWIGIFAFYGVVGWVIDSAYRTITRGAWERGGFSILPFTPSYGFAAVLLLALGPTLSNYALAIQWLVLGLFFAAYEYVCGHIGVLVMRRRLWDYSNGFLNVDGHTDLLHAAYWATLSLLTLYWFHPWIRQIILGE